MRITELIQFLSAVKEEYGNIDVCIALDGCGGTFTYVEVGDHQFNGEKCVWLDGDKKKSDPP